MKTLWASWSILVAQEAHIFFDEKNYEPPASWWHLWPRRPTNLVNLFFSVTIQDQRYRNDWPDPTLCLAKMGKYYRLCKKVLLFHYDVIMTSSTVGTFLRNLSKNSLLSRSIFTQKYWDFLKSTNNGRQLTCSAFYKLLLIAIVCTAALMNWIPTIN